MTKHERDLYNKRHIISRGKKKKDRKGKKIARHSLMLSQVLGRFNSKPSPAEIEARVKGRLI